VTSIAAKIGCTAQSLNEWVKKAQVDSGARAGVAEAALHYLAALDPFLCRLRLGGGLLGRKFCRSRSRTRGSKRDGEASRRSGQPAMHGGPQGRRGEQAPLSGGVSREDV
jgi:transposase